MATVSETRAAFLDYFAHYGHEIMPSSSLVPHNDPTLMFTNAGMNQFKNMFTGVEKSDAKRATTAQKCVRAGGKHNDLDNVGYTARHHTFFEMMGNFSFGDYFKQEAIELAWKLLTLEFKLPPEKLWITVYHDDDEAWNIWKKLSAFPDHKIIRISTSDNFWSMGETGPCGPCSEIFFDHGEHIPGGPPGSPDEDGDRFVEIWNLVFMQYDQQQGGERLKLPKPSIDTGMGLERMAAVLQGKQDNYEIDLFKRLMAASREEAGNSDPSSDGISHRVIADHLRSCSFLIADGIMPANEGRGYVLRRIMRRAMRHAHLLGCREPLMHRLVPTLVAEMGHAYPELQRAQANISETFKSEEERFRQTLDRGLKLLDEESSSLSEGQTLKGDVAFKLYDTYGFPLDLTEDILRSRGIGVDTPGFEASMDEQRERARSAWSGSGEAAVGRLWFDLKEKHGATEFLGYEHDDAKAKITAIVKGDTPVESAHAGDEVIVILEKTPFYGESGGQMGDSGELRKGSDVVAHITDTAKPLEDFPLHKATLNVALKIGDTVHAVVDAKRRDAIRANHSATHLLHKALRDQLGDHVTQKGSLVAPERLRFDFSHPRAMSAEEVAAVEYQVNRIIWQNNEVCTENMKPDDAINAGAMALFGEKYGDVVRVLSMGKHEEQDAAYSVELCGGTHVQRTGDIGPFKIISEGAVAAGIRRIEAVTRDQAYSYSMQQQNVVQQLAGSLKAPVEELPERLQKLSDENRKLGKGLAEAKKQLALGGSGGDSAPEKEMIGDVGFVSRVYEELPPKELRGVAEGLLKSIEPGVVVAASSFEGKASMVVAVSSSLAQTYSAVELVQTGVGAVGGKGGGGRPDMAQGGGPDADKLAEAVNAIKGRLTEQKAA